jgi:hypothetical protein
MLQAGHLPTALSTLKVGSSSQTTAACGTTPKDDPKMRMRSIAANLLIIAIIATAAPSAIADDGASFLLEGVTSGPGVLPAAHPTDAQVAQIVQAQRRAKTLLGDAFAGFWSESGTPNVAVMSVGSASPQIRSDLNVVGPDLTIEFREAAYSLSELEQAKALIPFEEFEFVYIAVDQINNRIKIVVPNGGAGEAERVLSERVPHVPFHVLEGAPISNAQLPDTCVSRTQCTPIARGGVQMIMSNGFVCSSGFSAVRNGSSVMLTAGHCAEAGTLVTHSGVAWGTILSSRFNGDTDGAVYSQTAAWQPSNWIYRADNTKQTGITGRKVTADFYVNELACKSGVTTDYTCGQITHTNVLVSVGGVLLDNQMVSNTCALKGDSGGPVFRTTTAMGVVSGTRIYYTEAGTPYCPTNASDRVMTFTPIRRIEVRIGATVRTTAP